MKSKVLLALWLIVVGAIVFLTVYFLGQDPDSQSRTGPNAPDVTQPVPGKTDGTEPGPRPRVNDRPGPTGRERLKPRLEGRVVDGNGTPVLGAALRVTLPVEAPKPKDTANEADIRFINAVIYIDPIEWDQPRPLRQFLVDLQAAAPERAAPQVVATGATDGEGRFEIELPNSVGSGPFRVAADSPIGKANVTGVRPGVDIEITVGPVAAASGFVYTGNENVGIGGAIVVLDDGEVRFSGRTGGDGRFRIEGVTPGRYRVSAGADGHPPLLAQEMVVQADQDLAIRLPRGTTLRVTATYEPDDGPDRPQVDAQVAILEQATLTYVVGTTDANGIVEFRGLPPGTYLINGRAAKAVSFGEEIHDISGESLLEEVELLFEPAIDTPLTVIDTDGQPVAGMVFYTSNADEEYDALRSTRAPGETDSNGRFDFTFEFDGPRAQIFGFKEGYAMVRVYPDAHDEGVPMTLIASPAIRVFGSVRMPEGRPVPDALVLIEVTPDDAEEDDFVILIRSGKDGRYDFPHVPRGEIWISAEVENEDYWSDDLDVELVEGKSEYQIDIELELE